MEITEAHTSAENIKKVKLRLTPSKSNRATGLKGLFDNIFLNATKSTELVPIKGYYYGLIS